MDFAWNVHDFNVISVKKYNSCINYTQILNVKWLKLELLFNHIYNVRFPVVKFLQ